MTKTTNKRILKTGIAATTIALIGAFGYGTYEFTSLAIMKDWTWRMVGIDLVWGTCLTAVSATAGVWITRTVA